MLIMNTSAYLATVPDEVVMTRDEFVKLLKRFRHHRGVRYGFSKKHTVDIEEYRKKTGATGNTMPSNLYEMPVTFNTDVTYVASK